jgi:crotonobetainyl-CoA:carnitine CoA-transferase CaiB-like acyl-CoA transferase
MIEDERFRTNTDRVRNRELVNGIVGAWFATKTRDDALRVMREADVTVGPVYTVADAVDDAHFRERAIVVETEDADLGSIPMHNVVPRLSGTPGQFRRPAPRLGEHTDAILGEAGYGADDIARLRQEGAVR